MTPVTPRFHRLAAALCTAGGMLSVSPAPAITITFDYTYDTSGFFSGANAGRRDVLTAAAAVFETRLTDNLSAINPSAGNSWSATLSNPSVPGANVSISDLSVPANTIVIYVGAADLGVGNLSQGAPGGYTSNGNSTWLNNVAARGQTGALGNSPTDFGPWGGSISFSSTTAWHADPNPNGSGGFSGESSLYTFALREIAHVLGFGTAPSWFTNAAGGAFSGANSVAVFGGTVPLGAGNAHWANGTLSTSLLGGGSQPALMTAQVGFGDQRYLTALDLAGLQDVGWTVVPEAPTLAWAAAIAGAGLWRWRRRRPRS